MLDWKRLFLLLILSECLGANTIEYMGIAFECDKGCAVPGYDWDARELVEIFPKVIRETFEGKWGLIDEWGTWQSFVPYHQNDEDILEETCEITRYDWEKSKGVLFHHGKDFYYKDVILNQEYTQTHLFDLTHSALMKEFTFFRDDLSFYAMQKEKYLKNRLKMHQQNLLEIAKLQEDFYGVLYDSDTDQVLGGTDWSLFYGLAHDCHNNCNGTYSRQIKFAQMHEEEEIQSIEEELKSSEYDHSLAVIDASHQKAENLLREIFLYCLRKHQPEGIEFQAAIESLLTGDPLDGIEHLRKLLEIGEKNNYDAQIISKIHFLKGQLESECTLYGDAIVSLTEAIAQKPSLKEAFLERAAAYFELGEFDLCIKDYLQSEISSESKPPLELISFSHGLTQGLISGGTKAGIEFIPSILSSLQGIGQGLWALVQDPVQVSSEFVQAAHICIEFIKDHSARLVFAELVPELNELIEKWDILEDRKKGEITGQIIGKYGVEIFAGSGLVKGVKLYRDLKRANNLLTFETLALSKRHKAFIKSEAIRKVQSRQEILSEANLKIQIDKQAKHMLQHRNFQLGEGIAKPSFVGL